MTKTQASVRDIVYAHGLRMQHHAYDPDADVTTQIKQLRQTADLLEQMGKQPSAVERQ